MLNNPASTTTRRSHGLTAANPALTRAEKIRFKRFREAQLGCLDPRDATEAYLAERIVFHRWLLLKCDQAEAAALRDAVWTEEHPATRLSDAMVPEMGDLIRSLHDSNRPQNGQPLSDHRTVIAFTSDPLENIWRYRVEHERALDRAENRFQAYRRSRILIGLPTEDHPPNKPTPPQPQNHPRSEPGAPAPGHRPRHPPTPRDRANTEPGARAPGQKPCQRPQPRRSRRADTPAVQRSSVSKSSRPKPGPLPPHCNNSPIKAFPRSPQRPNSAQLRSAESLAAIHREPKLRAKRHKVLPTAHRPTLNSPLHAAVPWPGAANDGHNKAVQNSPGFFLTARTSPCTFRRGWAACPRPSVQPS